MMQRVQVQSWAGLRAARWMNLSRGDMLDMRRLEAERFFAVVLRFGCVVRRELAEASCGGRMTALPTLLCRTVWGDRVVIRLRAWIRFSPRRYELAPRDGA